MEDVVEVAEVEVIRERQAPLAGPVPDGEEEVLKERPSFLEVVERVVVVAAAADGEDPVEDRLPVGLIQGPVNRNPSVGKKLPVNPANRTTIQVSC